MLSWSCTISTPLVTSIFSLVVESTMMVLALMHLALEMILTSSTLCTPHSFEQVRLAGIWNKESKVTQYP